MPRKEISFADWPAIEQAGSRLRYTFEERLEAPEGVSTLDVDLVAGTRSARVRTYTFGVRAAPEATRE